MRNLIFKKTVVNSITILFVMLILTIVPVSAQKTDMMGSHSDMEKIQDENMDYMKKINEIIKDYPAFSYSYKFDNGKVKDVVVTGVDNDIDRKKLEVYLFDLKSNKNMIKNQANRVGVFYSVDKEAHYKDGRDALERQIRSNLKYPEDAKNWGVEGTIYVKFVVDEDGKISYATTDSNIETSMETYLKELERQAVSAVKSTSGDWEPAKVEGVDVASLAVVPVTFDFEKNPTLPALIR